MALKVKVTEQHEWVRLALTESQDKQMSLIWSYSGDKVTGKGLGPSLMKTAIQKWHTIRDNAIAAGKTLGVALRAAAKTAEGCATIEEFVQSMC